VVLLQVCLMLTDYCEVIHTLILLVKLLMLPSFSAFCPEAYYHELLVSREELTACDDPADCAVDSTELASFADFGVGGLCVSALHLFWLFVCAALLLFLSAF
jgi:hypothetical protein